MRRGGGVADLPADRENLLKEQSTVGGCYYGEGGLPGTVWIENSNMDGQFQDDVYGLTTAKGDPDGSGEEGLYLGNVSGVCSASTGVRFMGEVNVDGGFRKGQNNVGRISNSAEFLLVIFDDNAVNNPEIPGIGFYGSKAVGYVDNYYAQVEIYWNGGTIALEGEIKGEDFMGEIHYRNSKHFDGKSPEQGKLGNFIIPVCSFFKCQ